MMGGANRAAGAELVDLEASNWNLFIIEDNEKRAPVLELFVDDLEQARKRWLPTAAKCCAGGAKARIATSRIPSGWCSTSGRSDAWADLMA